MATVNQSYGTAVSLSTTNLQNLANSATACWQSALVDLQTSLKPLDVEITFTSGTANTAAANDKAIYLFVCPATTLDGGTTWYFTDQGTTTLPTGTEGTTTIGATYNLRLLGVLTYTATKQVVQGSFLLSNAMGASMPDGFSLIVENFTGAALSISTTVLYRPITQTIA
jgi:hypothetical protein